MKKKIIVAMLSIFIGIVVGAVAVLTNIKIDGVYELDEKTITIKCFGQYFDYIYEK